MSKSTWAKSERGNRHAGLKPEENESIGEGGKKNLYDICEKKN